MCGGHDGLFEERAAFDHGVADVAKGARQVLRFFVSEGEREGQLRLFVEGERQVEGLLQHRDAFAVFAGGDQRAAFVVFHNDVVVHERVADMAGAVEDLGGVAILLDR